MSFETNLFKKIKESDYITSGDDVDWNVKVSNEDHTVYLIFQQSASKRDWQNNFDFPVEIYRRQETEWGAPKGWGRAYKSCNDLIMNSLFRAVSDNPDYRIVITGWSYGGAMAVLASEDFYYRQLEMYREKRVRTIKRADLITFGAPKTIYGKDAVEHFRNAVHLVAQYAQYNDCVTDMPPLPGYHHVGLVRCGEKFNLIKWFNPQKYHTDYGNEDIY